MQNIDLGIVVHECKHCDKYMLGVKVMNLFDWESLSKIIGYDKSTSEIIINEEGLMWIIRTMNPHQSDRRIRLISQEEFYGR